MKRILSLLLVLVAFTANAQVKTDTIKPVLNKTISTKPVLSKPVPAGTTTTQTKPTLTDADYYLAGVEIRVSTGSDNKEANNSTAFFAMRPRNTIMVAYKLDDYASEIKANEITTLRLERATTLIATENSLQYYRQKGLFLAIAYCNKNFCTDAWKINGVSITLEFKDANGNPAPNGFGTKVINFPVSSGTLGFIAGCNPFWVTDGKLCGHSDQLQKMMLKTDEYFNPLPARLVNWWTDDGN